MECKGGKRSWGWEKFCYDGNCIHGAQDEVSKLDHVIESVVDYLCSSTVRLCGWAGRPVKQGKTTRLLSHKSVTATLNGCNE